MECIVKRFEKLTAEELFEIYRLRVAVFVVEQNCPYQEVDDIDLCAHHVWLEEEGKILAYLRVFPTEGIPGRASIGRVIAAERRKGLGTRVLQEGIRVAEKVLHAETIQLEAQTYARELYEKQGFRQASEEFLEDGIPHILMIRTGEKEEPAHGRAGI